MEPTTTEWMILPLRRYAEFGGRSRRAEYWWFILFGLIVSVVAAVIDGILGLRAFGLGTIVSLGLFIPQLAVGFRRLHDLDRSGWWLVGPLLLAVPLGGMLGYSLTSGGLGAGVGGGLGGGSVLLGLLGLALVVYSIVLLVWFCQRGTVGDNRFGPDPLAGVALQR